MGSRRESLSSFWRIEPVCRNTEWGSWLKTDLYMLRTTVPWGQWKERPVSDASLSCCDVAAAIGEVWNLAKSEHGCRHSHSGGWVRRIVWAMGSKTSLADSVSVQPNFGRVLWRIRGLGTCTCPSSCLCSCICFGYKFYIQGALGCYVQTHQVSGILQPTHASAVRLNTLHCVSVTNPKEQTQSERHLQDKVYCINACSCKILGNISSWQFRNSGNLHLNYSMSYFTEFHIHSIMQKNSY